MNTLPPAWRFRAVLAALILPPLVHVISLPTLTRWLSRLGSPRTKAIDDQLLGEWVDRVLLGLPGPWSRTCLKRAVVLYYLLRRAGQEVGLRIGVRRDEGQTLEAHAWLERDGAPILESAADRLGTYQVLSRFS